MDFQAPDYEAELRRCVHGYTGSYARTVHRTPDLFDFYARLFSDDRLPPHARPLVNAVLAYFVVPEDVMPEETLGPYGLLDDVFLAAHVYRLLSRQHLPQELLADAWRSEDDLDEVMAEAYTDGRAALGKNRKDVLRMAGVSKGE